MSNELARLAHWSVRQKLNRVSSVASLCTRLNGVYIVLQQTVE